MPQLAFDGAEGYGKYSVGGRGGYPFFVTTTDDTTQSVYHPANEGDNPEPYWTGSYRGALLTAGARNIIFRVSGTIDLRPSASGLGTIYVTDPYVSIWGQTAPGDGVLIRGETTVFQTHNVIVQHLRGFGGLGSSSAGNQQFIAASSFTAPGACHDLIVDHCSAGWWHDDAFTSEYAGTDNITFQNSLYGEGISIGDIGSQDGSHGTNTGSVGTATDGGRISVFKNYYGSALKRTPGGGSGRVDMINNVAYNCPINIEIYPLYHSGVTNIVGNSWKKGPQNVASGQNYTILSYGGSSGGFQSTSTMYITGNAHLDIDDSVLNSTQSELVLYVLSAPFTTEEYSTRLAHGDTYVGEVSAAQAVIDVTNTPANGGAGAWKTCNSSGTFVLARPTIEARWLTDYASSGPQTGYFILYNPETETGDSFPAPASGATPYTDSNFDGIPDGYTLPTGAVATDLRTDGYTFFEGWVQERDRYWDDEPVNLPVNLGIQTYVLTNGVYTPLTGISVEAAGQNIDKVEFTVTGNNASLELSVTANADIDVVT